MPEACDEFTASELACALGEARVGGLLSVDREADADRVLAAVCSAARQRLADDAEVYAAEVIAEHGEPDPDSPVFRYLGGEFTMPDFDAPIPGT